MTAVATCILHYSVQRERERIIQKIFPKPSELVFKCKTMASNSDTEQDKPFRIVLLGKTGAGKSSLANEIFGEEEMFESSASPNSETKQCCVKEKKINGRLIQLIDTLGLFDTDLNNTDLSGEILRCIKECAPGPHAFLLVLKVERYTVHEQEVVQNILKSFSEEALKYTTVVFTHGDQLKTGQKIEDWVKENKDLKSLVDKCGGRCHVFDCKYWKNSQDSYRNNQVQVTELLKTIEQTAKEKNWKYYINVFLEYVITNMKKFWSFLKTKASILLGALLGKELSGLFYWGKTGAGKSSLANTLFGEKDLFKVNHSAQTQTTQNQSVTRKVNGRNIQLTDTPGVFDTDPERADLSPELIKFVTERDLRPHAFLLVQKVERFTKLEQAWVDKILEHFSERVLKFSIVVFTHGDNLPKDMKIVDWVDQNEALSFLVQSCGGHCHVFDSKYWDKKHDSYRNNKFQISQLLQTIEQTVRNNEGECYSNDL
ncbi:hypothetical protein WMY93_022291 [Mugilogobius chulae]|uniref:AIG1-type G domain-containing protein n=1 Tax=Mugilogobius chulae TaxID=88201 RepID=A0AAW0NCD1_9GOBI